MVPPTTRTEKKTSLSRAYFKSELVTEDRMPTPRAAATIKYLNLWNEFYKTFCGKQKNAPRRRCFSQHLVV